MIGTKMAKNEAASTVREEFSKLSLDGKTSFLVEAVFSTAGSAIHEIGERLNNLVELVTGSGTEAATEESGATETSSADEETASDADNASK